MSLLESMRSGTDSTFMQIVFVLVIATFVFWGVGGTGSTTTTVATVNGAQITGLEYESAVRRAELERSSMTQRGLGEDDRKRLREEVLQGLIRREALVQEAHALGLEVSDAEVAEALFQIPGLLTADGAFDKREYQNYLRRRGLTRSNFEEQIREELLVTKLGRLISLGASVSEPLVKQRYIEQNTMLDVQYVRVRPTQIAPFLELSDADVEQYLQEHGDRVRARYDDDLATKYQQPETLDVRMIRLQVREGGLTASELHPKLLELRTQAQDGVDFAELARAHSEHASSADGGLLEGVEVESLPERVATSLAGLEPGQLSEVIVTPDDVRLYRLEARTPASTVSFEDARLDIARDLLRASEAPTRAAEIAEKELLPAWQAAGEPPAELLERYGLSAASTGLVPASGATASLMRPPESLMKAARAAEVGAVLPEVFEHEGALWVAALAAREDADLAVYAENKDDFREQALITRRFEFVDGWVSDVVARAVVR